MGNRKTLLGKVVSNRMDKTVVVKVTTRRQHPRYKKYVEVSSKFKAHDETNACGIGDRVKIVESRPLSREKRWRVTDILPKAADFGVCTEAVVDVLPQTAIEAPAEEVVEAPAEAVVEAPAEAVVEAPAEAVVEAPAEAEGLTEES